jgi:hypothetical protein
MNHYYYVMKYTLMISQYSFQGLSRICQKVKSFSKSCWTLFFASIQNDIYQVNGYWAKNLETS